MKDDGEGTIEQEGDKGRNAGEVAKIAIPTGGTIGSIGGLERVIRLPEAWPAWEPDWLPRGWSRFSPAGPM